MQIISKYQIFPLYTLRKVKEALGKIKERTCSCSEKNSSNNSEFNLLKRARTVLLCLRAKVLTQERRSIYWIQYKFFFFLGSSVIMRKISGYTHKSINNIKIRRIDPGRLTNGIPEHVTKFRFSQ